jgi:hypothetical protein
VVAAAQMVMPAAATCQAEAAQAVAENQQAQQLPDQEHLVKEHQVATAQFGAVVAVVAPVVAVQAAEIQLAAQGAPEYRHQSVVHHWPMPAAAGVAQAPQRAAAAVAAARGRAGRNADARMHGTHVLHSAARMVAVTADLPTALPAVLPQVGLSGLDWSGAESSEWS